MDFDFNTKPLDQIKSSRFKQMVLKIACVIGLLSFFVSVLASIAQIYVLIAGIGG